jgi:D-inositol-3-phosphate glycosyltransferase
LDEFVNMNPLRIAIIDPVGKKAGLDHYNLSLAKSLHDKSCFVKVYSNFKSDKEAFVESHFTFRLYSRISVLFTLIPEYISALRKAKVEKNEFVIVHLFHVSAIDYLLLRLTKYFGFNSCLIVHDIESLIYEKKKSWISRCYDLANFMIVHNEFTYAELIRKISGKNKKKVYLIPHGNFIDLPDNTKREAAAEHFNLNPDKKYLLFFGMIKKSKGLEVLIEAMKNISPEAELIVAGRTRDVSFDTYNEIIKKLNLSKRVHTFIRYITNEERNLFFKLSDIVVIPYHRIYESGVAIMSMSYEVPVVASDLPANARLLDNERGVLFKSGNSSDLSSKINSLIADLDRSRAISKNARKFIATNHGWDNISDEFINVLTNR